MPSRESLTEALREFGLRLGFQDLRITTPDTGEWGDRFREWVDAGYAGEMAYMTRDPEKRSDPVRVMEDARSVILVSMNYFAGKYREALLNEPDRGYISHYALREDYHQVLKEKLETLLQFVIHNLTPSPGVPIAPFNAMGPGEGRGGGDPEVRGKIYVDTGPLLEKALAQRAGIGWIGKHTNLVTQGKGSWYFLGAILLNVDLPADPPAEDRCGRCSRCIDVCPTGAITAPYILDARRCISYLTIELKGEIPEEFRPLMGNRIFGCDDCQSVCPWNRFAREASESAFLPRKELDAPRLMEFMALDEEGFRRMFRGSPIQRIKRRGFLRNVAVALGNSGSREAIPVLTRALQDPEPLIRTHAAWALERIMGREDAEEQGQQGKEKAADTAVSLR